VRISQALAQRNVYTDLVDTLLLDAYHPQLGGTGKTLDWVTLRQFQPTSPWLWLGDPTPDNVRDQITLHPSGIDLSVGGTCPWG